MVSPRMDSGSRKRKQRRERTTSSACCAPVVAFSTMVFITLVVAILYIVKTGDKEKGKEQDFFSDPSEIPAATIKSLDAILVLGGGRPSALEKPPLYVQRRCDDAAAVVQRRMTMSKNDSKQIIPILCLSAGTAHMPQLLSTDGLPIWESTATAAYLEQQHGLRDNVYVETTSYDTIGNAFFARTSHTDIMGWRRLLIVTNKFHMARTRAIFDWIFSLDKQKYKLFYLESQDVGLSADALEARQSKEEKSISTIQSFAKQYKSLRQVWTFLNTKHDLYSAEKLVERGKRGSQGSITDSVKKSYGAQ